MKLSGGWKTNQIEVNPQEHCSVRFRRRPRASCSAATRRRDRFFNRIGSTQLWVAWVPNGFQGRCFRRSPRSPTLRQFRRPADHRSLGKWPVQLGLADPMRRSSSAGFNPPGSRRAWPFLLERTDSCAERVVRPGF